MRQNDLPTEWDKKNKIIQINPNKTHLWLWKNKTQKQTRDYPNLSQVLTNKQRDYPNKIHREN